MEPKDNQQSKFSPNNFELKKLLNFKEADYENKINCADFSPKTKKLVYGCSNGIIKVLKYFQDRSCFNFKIILFRFSI